MNILSSERKNISEKLLKKLYEATFKYNSDKNYLNVILFKYEQSYPFLKDYIAYYKKQWFRFFENGKHDYTNITKSQRSNS